MDRERWRLLSHHTVYLLVDLYFCQTLMILFFFSGVDQLLSEGTKEEAKPVVNFVFLTRSGNKQQYSSVEMPVDSELVTKLRTREEVIN